MADIGPGPIPRSGHATAARSGAPPGDKGSVFLSYSRDDIKFADQLDRALVACGFDCLRDQGDISAGEEWRRRLTGLIRQSDTVVFLLSRASANSPHCRSEYEEAKGMRKRIIPVVSQDLGGVELPEGLEEINYVFFYEAPKQTESGWGKGLKQLVDALNTDLDWLRDHTRYLSQAIRWDERGRTTNRLLFGDDIAAAKDWTTRRPRNAPGLTDLQREFIRASEEEGERSASAERQRLEEMARNYELRDQALHEAEAAVQKEREAQRKRARSVTIIEGLAGLVLCAALAAVYLYSQAKTYSYDASDLIYEVEYNMKSEQQERADDLFQRAVGFGNAAPLRYLGVALRNGWGHPKNVAEATAKLKQAAERGDADAMDNLGSIYESGESGVGPEYDEARKWYEKAERLGNLNAMNNLGRLYREGRGVQPDAVKALAWYHKVVNAGAVATNDEAAKAVKADAMFHLGEHYEVGGALQNDYEALYWYMRAADAGHADAMVKVAEFYNGDGAGAHDIAKARELYEKAAKADNANAMFSLGALSGSGGGDVAQDTAEMLAWYERAAAAGNPDAMLKLGAIYDEGRCVARDAAKARAWYEKAADKGNVWARELMQFLPLGYNRRTGR